MPLWIRRTWRVASSVIAIFEEHVGRKYGELVEELEGLEEINYRLIRGLAQLLERRCVIGEVSGIDPIAARRAVFEDSRGFVTGQEERKEVLERVARRLSIKADDLETALWADQEENLVVKDLQAITPENLLEQYNLSLAQTLLFKAAGLEIWIEDNYQQIFRKIKQLGLMYSILGDKISLDGPISLFKLTEKYGTAFAKLLPTVMLSAKWSLKASIIKKTAQGKRVYDFALDHTKKEMFGTEFGIEETKTIGFDSVMEQEFYQLSFKGWMVRREPTVLKAGQCAFIPDFSLVRNGARVYIEIVGFWTPEYLKHKVQKINQLVESENMILLVNRNLACSGSEFETGNLIFYDRKIPHLEIIKVLRKYEEQQLAEEITRLRTMEISLDSIGGIVSLDEVARRYDTSLEALKEVIKGQCKSDYVLLGDQLVSNEILKTIQAELGTVKKHAEALKTIERYGIRAHRQVLALLGYKIKWNGLASENAEILKA